MTEARPFNLGIDIGSTTAKLVLINPDQEIIYTKYIRHNTQIIATLLACLLEMQVRYPISQVQVAITGTAGMGVAEKTGLYFVQEVVSAADVVTALYPECHTLIDLGGEDAKIIFFSKSMKPDIRMNGACAGGTGAFIDQMATLLGYPIEELSSLASQHTTLYPIASRCGVFAKTDVQNLIARGVKPADIAASIFKAVAYQTVNALARGIDIKPKLIFTGGPLTFMPALRAAFYNVLNLTSEDHIEVEHTEVFPALGAALNSDAGKTAYNLSDLIEQLQKVGNEHIPMAGRLEPLFANSEAFLAWEKKYNSKYVVEKVLPKEVPNHRYFLGIDSGSTTTKIILIDEHGAVAARHYSPNNGNPIDAVHRGLSAVKDQLAEVGVTHPTILRAGSTGYGEDLTRFAFKLDDGLVETLAHFKAASYFEPKVSFILDIGGQDMKAIFIENGIVTNLELNESCSSGSGSFIETFAKNMQATVPAFAQEACHSQSPCDLGTRCTVFMNSKVKQALREGATQGDISAGLAYSVIKNCFQKVLKITNMELLGEHVVVQGGTFKNPAVLRALEKIIGQDVVRPDICELMGAYGAALVSLERWKNDTAHVSTFVGFDNLDEAQDYTRRTLTCKGCENLCTITQMTFDDPEEGDHRKFYSGNKCENIFTNKLVSNHQGFNMHRFKRDLLWERPMASQISPSRGRIGMPRVLNMWDDFPFWHALFVAAGFDVVLSDPSTVALAEPGYSSVMSESICYPAKIVNGHILNLAEKQVDRMFYPIIMYERSEYDSATNQYNCPVVSGYPEVIDASINPARKFNIPFDKPCFAMNDPKLMFNGIGEYFVKTLGVDKNTFKKAFDYAQVANTEFRLALHDQARAVIKAAKDEKRPVMMVLGRPYHVDALINHKLPEMISALGVDLLTEDCLPDEERSNLQEAEVLTQWAFPNRIYDAAIWSGSQDNVEVVHINSFGCGPDAVTIDEVKAILNSFGKNPTVIRVDEITSPGSVRLRIRSMIESMAMRAENFERQLIPRVLPKTFEEIDRSRTILAPDFSPFYTRFIVKPLQDEGYKLEILPPPDRESINVGLVYSNNDICYPATIVIGDLIKALQSGKYDLDKVAVCLTQTGGQCRASSYLSMLKKGMVAAGFEQVPVVAVNTHEQEAGRFNDQPGFVLNRNKFMAGTLLGILYGDVLGKLYWAFASYEVNQGDTQKICDKWLKAGEDVIDYQDFNATYRLMRDAVADFNTIEVRNEVLPKVGIVGEIFIKFNEFGNNYAAKWLIKQGIQPEFPPLVNFFLSTIVETSHNKKRHLENYSWADVATIQLVAPILFSFIKKANRILAKSKLPITPIHDIRDIAKNASGTMDLVLQFGESWLLPGDIITFAKEGTTDVLCLQPFGCIANHIIAKGMEKKLKEHYPQLNLLFLDMDAGSSEVNLINRLSFLARGAQTAQPS